MASSHSKVNKSVMSDQNSAVICAEVFELVNEGVFFISPKGEVSCNQPLRLLLNLPAGIVSREKLLSKLRDTPDESASRKLDALLKDGLTGEVALPIKNGSGSIRTMHLALIFKMNGQALFTYRIVREILPSSKNEAADALWLFRAIFDGIEDGILILDPITTKIRRANQAASRIFGLPIEALLETSVLELLAAEGRQNEIRSTITAKLPFLKSIHLDLEMRRSNGTTFPALHGIGEITSPTGEVIAWMWIVTDMTQRVFLNRALIDLETRYRLLFDRTADPTLIIDANSRKIIDANTAAENQLGYKRTELIGLAMEDITPDTRQNDMERDFTQLNVGESATIEGVNLNKRGDEIPVQISVVATDFEGRKVFIASCRDVSEQKILEQERLKFEKLDAVRKVAGGLAHEFSQPLQGLITICDIISQPGIDAGTQAELVKKIPPSVERMAVLLDQMKRIVRLETKPYAGSDDIVDIQHSSRTGERV